MEATTRVVVGLAGVTAVSGSERDGALMGHNLGDAAADDAGGVFVSALQPGRSVRVETANHNYLIRYLGNGQAEISGHPRYCPQPVKVRLHGTHWLDSRIPECYLAPGMRLQFVDPSRVSVMTSPIRSVALEA
ncbi:MAG: hypothetical protein GC160_19225 [Acidobacteria bacterium]|nr:hypothetical protein [Acidobacteriota bacterium]